jgi:uncharacterized protein
VPAVVAPVDISLQEARRIALAAQGFTDPRPKGRVDRRHFRKVLERLATVQLDSVNVLDRSHELVFFSRLGPYDRAALSRWLWESHEVFEYWGHEASLHPIDRQPLLRWRMAQEHAWAGVRQTVRDYPAMLASALTEIADRGPVMIGELDVHKDNPRHEEHWWGWGDGKRVVEGLFYTGKVTAVRRNGFARAYMVPERWFPPRVLAAPTPPPDQAQRALLLLAAKAHGVGTARDLADYYRLNVPASGPLLADLVDEGELVPARVEGWRQPAFLHPDAFVPRRRLRARALLSPFDSTVWERQRTERLWGFRYRIEIYVPAPKREHGYYVLPFLLGDDLVARVDLKADRQAVVLRVRAAFGEDRTAVRRAPGPTEVAAELAAELALMAGWLGLTAGVAVEPRGDLAEDLTTAVAAA